MKKTRTIVINIRYEDGTKDFIDISRGSKWGNPFKIGKDGDREEVIEKYKEWILSQPELLNSLYELKDQRLGCHCVPYHCHGHVLVELIEEREDNGSDRLE
jgi:hypothetical protein